MQLDHLVVAAADLESGAQWVEQRLGVRPVRGGQHGAMGTHNALLDLDGCYLEVIAIDPTAVRPTRPRWFALDEFRGPPRLVHWVARATGIEQAAAGSSEPLGAVMSAARGALRWRITVPADGHLPGDGLVPTLIEWAGPSAGSQLPRSGCRLLSLHATHPDPEPVRRALLSLGAALDVAGGGNVRLLATVRGAHGVGVLD